MIRLLRYEIYLSLHPALNTKTSLQTFHYFLRLVAKHIYKAMQSSKYSKKVQNLKIFDCISWFISFKTFKVTILGALKFKVVNWRVKFQVTYNAIQKGIVIAAVFVRLYLVVRQISENYHIIAVYCTLLWLETVWIFRKFCIGFVAICTRTEKFSYILYCW